MAKPVITIAPRRAGRGYRWRLTLPAAYGIDKGFIESTSHDTVRMAAEVLAQQNDYEIEEHGHGE